ncbi:uncharacterized protein C8R40DRAFT_58665 [Lentinula edodes]|uniref:uncharacterized protein n=1 Tax=Lentinula edodes TaxID=5353 RepID=UPI001E8D382B|nr:uncharacterized protein C8R40DRAFT_58665 [Lentinula edodes]KAH7881657.1 hypothetical protein C8R40DRAFT_58665 [Lentinula edodes]KAJ3921052.1 hypothetical protein F5877DRAFT_76563 [Lentinula edodes]
MYSAAIAPIRRPSSPDSTMHNQGYSTLKNGNEDSESVELEELTRSPLRPHYGTAGRRTGYLTILGLFFGSILIAVINHVVFSKLDGKPTAGRTEQFWVTTLKNVFPAAVALLLFVDLKYCLSQVALYRIRSGSHPIGLVSLMTSPPNFTNTISILLKSSMRASILIFFILAVITQAVTVTSIFIPGALTVTQSSPVTTSLEIPNVDFNAVNPMTSSFVTVESDTPPTLSFLDSSQRWRQLIIRAASANVAPTWDAPVGCGSSCTYNFTYSAPALNCTELSKQDIWPSGTNTSDSRLAFPLNTTDPNESLNEYFFYNSSFAFTSEPNTPNVSSSTLDVYYMENFNTTYDQALLLASQYPDPTQYNPRGAHCEYQNATYEATTTFLNNTQSSSVHVKELNGYLPIGHDADGPYPGTNTTNMTLAFRSIAQSFNEILSGNAFYQTNSSGLVTDSTQALNTPLFSLTGVIQNVTATDSFQYNEYLFLLSPTFKGNLSDGIEELLGNITLAFVNEGLASTIASVTVTPSSTQYQYHAVKLAVIYGIVFAMSLVVVIYGLVCIWENGTTAVFDLEHIIEMTAGSTNLHKSALHPEFSSTYVRGLLFPAGNSTRTILDTSRERE